jgi:hypothetical protein
MHVCRMWFLRLMEFGGSKAAKVAENRHFTQHYKFPTFER